MLLANHRGWSYTSISLVYLKRALRKMHIPSSGGILGFALLSDCSKSWFLGPDIIWIWWDNEKGQLCIFWEAVRISHSWQAAFKGALSFLLRLLPAQLQDFCRKKPSFDLEYNGGRYICLNVPSHLLSERKLDQYSREQWEVVPVWMYGTRSQCAVRALWSVKDAESDMVCGPVYLKGQKWPRKQRAKWMFSSTMLLWAKTSCSFHVQLSAEDWLWDKRLSHTPTHPQNSTKAGYLEAIISNWSVAKRSSSPPPFNVT